MGSEFPLSDGDAILFQVFDGLEIKIFCLLRRFCVIEGRSVSSLKICSQGKLTDDEYLPAFVKDGEIGPFVFISVEPELQ